MQGKHPRLLLLIGLGIIFILLFSEVVAILSVSAGTDLSIHDESDRGMSILYDSVPDGYRKQVLLTSPSLLVEEDDPKNTLLVNIGPQREYSLSEVHLIKKFINRGGKVLMADDRGYIASLAAELDVTMVKGQLFDENFEGTPDLVRVDDVKIGDFNGVVLLNKPASLIITEGQGFIRTSDSSWVDRNGNGVMDGVNNVQGESPGPRLVGAITVPDFNERGSGTAVFLSDPSLFMNWMIGEEGNLELFQALVEHLLPEGGKVIFDEGATDSEGVNMFLQKVIRLPVLLSTDINMKIVLGTLAAISLFAVAYMHEPPMKRKHISILDRTGVAEIVDPSIYKEDIPEVRKVLLERVRISHGMSREAFASLSWDDIGKKLKNDILFDFARTGELRKDMDLTTLLVEVNGWERK